ncbi:MAG: hypothetical protein WCE45_08830 [Sedimentisphaerales bacterium]
MNMKKFICLLAIPFFISFLSDCTGSSRKPRRNIKAAELISRQQPLEGKFMTVDLHIYVFRIQTKKLPQIQNQIGQTNALPVKYDDPDAFLANGLICCQGDRASWQKIAQLLALSQSKTIKQINILMTENTAEDIVIAEAVKSVSAIYYSNNATAGINFDAGQMVLRLKVSPLIGLRQACRLDVTPVYKIISRESKKLKSSEKNREFIFDSAALSVRWQPDRYVLIAPANAKEEQNEAQTIGNIISYRQTPEDTADLCLIACDSINSPL